MIPYHLEQVNSGFLEILGIASVTGIAEAVERGLGSTVLPLDISIEDPLFVRLDDMTFEVKKGYFAAKSFRLLFG